MSQTGRLPSSSSLRPHPSPPPRGFRSRDCSLPPNERSGRTDPALECRPARLDAWIVTAQTPARKIMRGAVITGCAVVVAPASRATRRDKRRARGALRQKTPRRVKCLKCQERRRRRPGHEVGRRRRRGRAGAALALLEDGGADQSADGPRRRREDGADESEHERRGSWSKKPPCADCCNSICRAFSPACSGGIIRSNIPVMLPIIACPP